MKKVAFINIFRSVGGGEIYLYRLINTLYPYINVESILISPPCEVLDSLLIKKEYISGVSMELNTYTIYEMLKSIIEINLIIKKNKVDLIIINGDRAILLSPFLFSATTKIGIKHMLISSRSKFLINWLPFICLDKVVTISNFHIKNYLSFGGEKYFSGKLRMIYNAVNTDSFNIKHKKDNHEIITFVEIASLEKRKGQLDLLIAFEELHKKYKNIRLNFVGSGKEEKEYRKFIEKHKLCDLVSFYGFQRNVKPFLSYKKTVFVLPSYDEGLPIVLLEAMSNKLPVISTSVAGIPEIIDQGINGFIFVPGHIQQLIQYMEFFIQQPEQIDIMGIKGRSKVVDVFNEEEWKKQWLAVL